MANDPVPVAVRYLQAVLAMIILGIGGFSIYAYFNMDGLIADGGIVPLIGCGVSVFGVGLSFIIHALRNCKPESDQLFEAFWALFAACSRNPYFHFGVAKFFLGGLIVIAVGSSVVAGWVCGDSYNTSSYSNNTSCNPASIASPEFTTGIVTAAFDGIELQVLHNRAVVTLIDFRIAFSSLQRAVSVLETPEPSHLEPIPERLRSGDFGLTYAAKHLMILTITSPQA
jgi:hypothetical protein